MAAHALLSASGAVRWIGFKLVEGRRRKDIYQVPSYPYKT